MNRYMEKKRVAMYARFSSDNQRTESIDAQIRAMKEYCVRNRLVIVETYIDEAKSATNDRRPAFQQMIQDSQKHAFDIVLVHKLDRFARNRYDSAVYKRALKKNGVQVYSVLENLDDSPESIMMEAVLEGMSEYYSQNLAREVMKGLKETALQCKHTGGTPPLGYDVDEETKRLIVNEEEAEAVQIIFDMYSRGYGYGDILKRLYHEGKKTKKGADFSKNSLYSILTNPKYQGVYVFNRLAAKSIDGTRNSHLFKAKGEMIVIEGGCPQLVDPLVYQKVQERIVSNRHSGGKGNANTAYLLSGKVFCKECGRSMIGNKRYSGQGKNLYITYRCPTNRQQCRNREMNQKYLDAFVVDLLEKHLFNARALKRCIHAIEERSQDPFWDSKRERLCTELASVKEALANVTRAVEDGLLSEALSIRLQELEVQKIELEQELESCTGKGMVQLTDSKRLLEEYRRIKNLEGTPEYRSFIKEFVTKIEVARYTVYITLKTGLGVFPELDTIIQTSRREIYERT